MWNSAMISRASTSVGTPASMAATVTVSAFESVSRPDCHETSDRSGGWDPLKVFGIGPFGPTSARRPFAHHPQRAPEATRRQTAPEFSAVSAAGRPLIVEPWQMHIERTLPGPEDIVAFAADHLPHQLPAVAGLARDLLDRHAALR